MRRRELLAVASGALAATAGCVGSGSAGSAGERRGAESGDDYDVGMSVRAYRPDVLEVTPGTTVVWRNTSRRRHTVTAVKGRQPEGAAFFASGGYPNHEAAHEAWNQRLQGGLDPGRQFEHTFETPGTHLYHCIPHESRGMKGAVKVRDPAGEPDS